MKQLDWKGLLPVFFKGMGMGAADVVPGVSGGTIAFITGIYERLIDSIRAIDAESLKILFKEGVPSFWKRINGTFLLFLFAGIVTSVLSLVRMIHYLLEEHPILLWSFFFGLIVASAIAVGLKVKEKNIQSLLFLAVGIAIAWFITSRTPAETPNDLWFIFLSGSLAICAMILPGISGSFILLLLRKYEYVTGAIKDLDIVTIAVFLSGCFLGLISFAKVLGWMFKRYHDATVALMTGFMLGSLNVVWPWKEVLETRITSSGEEEAFRFESVLPSQFEGDPQTAVAVIWAVVGFGLILGIEWLSTRGQKQGDA
jgi:putative membrane protein